jgi:hypothetical protein
MRRYVSRLHRDGREIGLFTPKGVSIPLAVSILPDGIYPAPRSCSAGRLASATGDSTRRVVLPSDSVGLSFV